MKATGTNTESSTSVIAMIGAVISRHRLLRRLGRREIRFFLHDAFDVLDHDDGVVDEDADRQHHREQRHRIGGIARSASSTAKVPMTLTGTAIGRDDGRAQAAEKQEDDDARRAQRRSQA